jgi:glucokinase
VFGECTFGAGRGLKNVVYITLSTGLGGGAVVDGRLLLGKDGNAAEVGHLTIDPESPLVCGCGCKGHWEAYCSGRNIPNFARLIIGEERVEGKLISEISDGELSKITAENLFEAAYRGDRTARHIVSRIGEVNAVGFANVVNVFDPELLTVGGSIAIKNQGLVLKPVLDNIESHLINRCPDIMITPLGLDTVLYGALSLALKRASDGERAQISRLH